jgi:hypothetical protein
MISSLAIVALLSFGCRSDPTPPLQQDASVTPHGDGGGQTDAPPTTGDGPAGYNFANVKGLRAVPPAPQTTVSIAKTVVIGVKGNWDDIWVMDEDGGPKSGLDVYCPGATSHPCAIPETFVKTLKQGMRVQVTGLYDVYNGKIELKPTAINILDSGAIGALPTPNDITAAQAAESVLTSDYQGTLVNITGVGTSTPLTVTSVTPATYVNSNYTPDCLKGPPYSAFMISDGSSTLAVETTFYRDIHFSSDPGPCGIKIFDGGTPSGTLVTVGGTFTKLTGVLDIDTFVQKMVLAPNNDAAYTYVAAP